MSELKTYTQSQPDRRAIGSFFRIIEAYCEATGIDEPDLMPPISCVTAVSEQDAISQVEHAESAIQFDGHYLVFIRAIDRNHWINIVGVAENAIRERQATQVHAGRRA